MEIMQTMCTLCIVIFCSDTIKQYLKRSADKTCINMDQLSHLSHVPSTLQSKLKRHSKTHSIYHKIIMNTIGIDKMCYFIYICYIASCLFSDETIAKIILSFGILLDIISNLLFMLGIILNRHHTKLMSQYQLIADEISDVIKDQSNQNNNEKQDKHTTEIKYNFLCANCQFSNNSSANNFCDACDSTNNNFDITIKNEFNIDLCVNDTRKCIFNDILNDTYNLYITKDIMHLIFDIYLTKYFDIYGEPLLYETLKLKNPTSILKQLYKNLSKYVRYGIDDIHIVSKSNPNKIISCVPSDSDYLRQLHAIQITVEIKNIFDSNKLVNLIQLLARYNIEYGQDYMYGIWNLNSLDQFVKLHELFYRVQKFLSNNNIMKECVNMNAYLVLDKIYIKDIWMVWIKWKPKVTVPMDFFNLHDFFAAFNLRNLDEPKQFVMTDQIFNKDAETLECVHVLYMLKTKNFMLGPKAILSLYISHNFINTTAQISKIQTANDMLSPQANITNVNLNGIEVRLTNITRISYTLVVKVQSKYVSKYFNWKAFKHGDQFQVNTSNLQKHKQVKIKESICRKAMKYRYLRNVKCNKKKFQSKHQHKSRKNKRYKYHRW
eukprot:361151_1